MPIQNRVQGSTIFKIIAQETDKYMGYSPKRNLTAESNLKLSSGVSM